MVSLVYVKNFRKTDDERDEVDVDPSELLMVSKRV